MIVVGAIVGAIVVPTTWWITNRNNKNVIFDIG
jgi:hypothetical protein